MKILIVDDDLQFSESLQLLLHEGLDEAAVSVCQCGEQLEERMEAEGPFDLLLMDIRLEGEDGIALARKMTEKYAHLPVVFITGYPEQYYEKVFLSVRPSGFLSKPVKKELLFELIHRLMQEKKEYEHQWLTVKTKSGVERLSVSGIIYLESEKHLLKIHSTSGIFEVYGRLTDLAEALPDSFFHCHKSFLVNASHIRSYERDRFVLLDGTCIPISQLRRGEIRRKFFHYLSQEE